MGKTALPAAVTPEVSTSNNEIFGAVFDTLMTFGPNFQNRPAVAEKWEYLATQQTWRFSIRKDLVFSNGDKLTADDVVYSTNLIVEKNLPTRSFISFVTGAKKADDYTVDITSRVPDVTVLNGGPWIYVLPAKYHQETGTQQFGVKPIGSGPYELTEFKPGDSISFRLRTAAHAYRKPIATELRFRAIPELAQQINGLRTGDIDIVTQSSFTADHVDQLQRADLVVVNKLVSNVTALFSQPEAEARNTPLKDKRVRTALNYAVNKDSISQALYKGVAQSVGQLGVPESPFWDPSVRPYPYDPAMAKRLLADAGYPNGFKLPVGIEYTSQTVNPQLILALQGALKDVGVEAEVNGMEFALFLDKYYGRNGQNKGDLFVQSLGDINGMFSEGRGRYDCARKDFEIWWCNPDFTRLYDQAI